MGFISHWVRSVATRSRNLRILFKYNANLWKYNCQKALDTLLHGRPQQTKHIPFMITNKMKKSLNSLGYVERDINKMTPSEAITTINHCTKKSTKEPALTEVERDNSTGRT